MLTKIVHLAPHLWGGAAGHVARGRGVSLQPLSLSDRGARTCHLEDLDIALIAALRGDKRPGIQSRCRGNVFPSMQM